MGILHSQTGVMAMSESQLADASFMAIDEINREGGLLGRLESASRQPAAIEPAVPVVQTDFSLRTAEFLSWSPRRYSRRSR